MFVDEVFSKTTLFLEFVKRLRVSLTLNDNLQTQSVNRLLIL
jgi:hypothetical protein